MGSYYSRFYRPGWCFLGSEVDLGTGHIGLVWRTATGLVVIDEVKMTGVGDVVDDHGTVKQVRRYLEGEAQRVRARPRHGLQGVRLLRPYAMVSARAACSWLKRSGLVDVEAEACPGA